MREVATSHGLIVTIAKVTYPNKRVRVDVNRRVVDVRSHTFIFPAVRAGAGSGTPIYFIVAVFVKGRIYLAAAGKTFLQPQISQRLITVVDIQFPVDVTVFIKVTQHVVRNGVTDPLDKLAVFVIGNLGVIHVEPVDGNPLGALDVGAGDVLVGVTNVGRTGGHVDHAVGRDAFPIGAVKHAG